ncbi:hypothetical protein CICLE_v10023051mg [Citrus x clementina]|uniref:Uncharacterized protein n=2 Tax=Citrus TaxID=2706 RepID=A0A067DAB6_CITSI|nr:hypothetical protein CICLE_v10023051mg [Citrus x clementina]KDO39758.1 hypothetical protein CISIN_1g034436mg [Citrus sinensis]
MSQPGTLMIEGKTKKRVKGLHKGASQVLDRIPMIYWQSLMCPFVSYKISTLLLVISSCEIHSFTIKFHIFSALVVYVHVSLTEFYHKHSANPVFI